MNEDWRNEAHQRMKTMAEGIAQSMGGSCEFNINRGYPFLVNDTDVTDHVTASAAAYLGNNNVTEAEIWMAAEDFARYSQQVPSCFYLLGTGNQQKGITSSLHTSTFDVDEDMLVNSMGLMAWVAVKALV